MKKTLITAVCLMFVAFGYAQQNNERYEYCAFRVAEGFSNGAVTTDFVLSKDNLTTSLLEASRDQFLSKDYIFDVQFLAGDDGAIIRVFHLKELSSDDLKVLFAAVAGNIDYVIEPSRVFKFDANGTD